MFAKRNAESRIEFDYRWRNASVETKSGLIKKAYETEFGIHNDPSKAISNWNNKPLEKLPIFLRNGIAMELMFGDPNLKKTFFKD